MRKWACTRHRSQTSGCIYNQVKGYWIYTAASSWGHLPHLSTAYCVKPKSVVGAFIVRCSSQQKLLVVSAITISWGQCHSYDYVITITSWAADCVNLVSPYPRPSFWFSEGLVMRLALYGAPKRTKLWIQNLVGKWKVHWKFVYGKFPELKNL